jgi:RNA-directed DNA polymerase
MVWKAYQLVKRNGKAAGVDGQSLDDFAKDLENNLYKLWNRMASGSYFPPPVRRVEIPKSGGVRPLGIPRWPIVSRRWWSSSAGAPAGADL